MSGGKCSHCCGIESNCGMYYFVKLKLHDRYVCRSGEIIPKYTKKHTVLLKLQVVTQVGACELSEAELQG
jgi:hypothetical protein